MDDNKLEALCIKFKNYVKKPEKFLSVQESLEDEVKNLLKDLYDYLKKKETFGRVNTQALSELLIDHVDEEQIWQELTIQNDEINNQLVKDLAFSLAKKDNLTFDIVSPDENLSDESESEREEIQNEESSDADSLGLSDEEHTSNDEVDDTLKFTSEVDDEFFKLCEMENFCEAVEKDNAKTLDLDLFAIEPDDEDEESRLIRYKDFFVKDKGKSKKSVDFEQRETKNLNEPIDQRQGKKVSFALETGDKLSADAVNNESNDDSDAPNEEDRVKSNFEARQERLKSRIKSLEEEALKEKPWHMTGEVTSIGRPQNSLLEEYVEFDVGARSAPVFTEKTTLRLEDIIKQRVKDKSWDDVARKVKPADDIREYRKQLVLDQEKSKLSLAEIYEEAYVKQRDAGSGENVESKEEAEPPEHVEIKKMMRSVFTKLDALCNFHYTPKAVVPEIKIVSNLPAITMEEVAPVATSNSTLLAPEEIRKKTKSELKGDMERTTTDKKRDRRKKKLKQRLREKEKKKKDKTVKKLSLGLGNKYSKESAKTALDKLTKERNIDKLVQSEGKQIKSSSTFFNKLEEEVKMNLKRKQSVTKKMPIEKFTAKRLKL